MTENEKKLLQAKRRVKEAYPADRFSAGIRPRRMARTGLLTPHIWQEYLDIVERLPPSGGSRLAFLSNRLAHGSRGLPKQKV